MDEQQNLHEGFEAREYGRAKLELGDKGRLILHLPDPTPAEKKRLKAAWFTEQDGGQWWNSLPKTKVEGVGFRRQPRPPEQVAAIQEALERFAKQAKPSKGVVEVGRHGFLAVAKDGDGFRVTHEKRFDDSVHGSIKRLGGRWNAGGWDIPATHEGKLAAFLSRHRKASEEAIAEEAAQAEAAVRAAAEAVESSGIEAGDYGVVRLRIAERKGVKGYRLDFPYHAELVEGVKDGTSAKYDPGMKTWFVPGGNEDALRNFLANAEKVGEEVRAERERTDREAEVVNNLEEAHRKQFTRQRKPRRLYPVSQLPSIGETLALQGKVMVVTGYGSPRTIDDDAPSINGSHLLGHEGERGRYAYLREATPEEAEEAGRVAAEKQNRDAKDRAARETLKQAAHLVRERGTMPDPANGQQIVEGERLLDTENIYGGGDWWVIQPDRIWYIRNNGADGDAWSANNVRTGGAGAIGWHVPYNEALARTLRAEGEQPLEPNAVQDMSVRSKNAKKALLHYAALVRELNRGGGDLLIEDPQFRDAWRMRAEDEMPPEVMRYFDDVRKHSGYMPSGYMQAMPSQEDMAERLGIDLDAPENKGLKRLIL